jgi:hypothetical protein
MLEKQSKGFHRVLCLTMSCDGGNLGFLINTKNETCEEPPKSDKNNSEAW